MSEIVRPGEGSPFDAIKRIDEDGNEFWWARELQSVMAYARWENFEVPLQRAMKAAENVGADLTSNFLRSQKITGKRSAIDYRLTRYAAYLVAMNGDPNKAEVAAAQTYFAVKTREAEVARPQSQLDVIAAVVAEMQRVERETFAKLQAIEERADDTLATVTEIVARQDAIEGKHDWFAGLGYARLQNWSTDRKFLQRLGTRAGRIGRAAGLKVSKVQHGLYGEVNQWPAWCWEAAYEELGETA